MPFLLQKFTKHDFSDYFSLVSNFDVMQMITERAIPLPEAQSDYTKILENNKIDDYFGHFKIINPENHQFIGLAKLEIQEKNYEAAEIGYILLPTYWGQGIASHITQQLLEIAKNQESLQTVFAIIDPSNLASKKILMKHAFKSKEFKNFDGLPGEVLELNVR